MFCYDPVGNTWTAISSSGTAPSGGAGPGFAAAPDGTLYVFGGLSNSEYPPMQLKYELHAGNRGSSLKQNYRIIMLFLW